MLDDILECLVEHEMPLAGIAARGHPIETVRRVERTAQLAGGVDSLDAIERLKAALELVDMVRLDHFRGFEAYWSVPAGSETAEPTKEKR